MSGRRLCGRNLHPQWQLLVGHEIGTFLGIVVPGLMSTPGQGAAGPMCHGNFGQQLG